MIPYKTLISINRKSNQAVYLQISNQIINLIKEQVLSPNSKLPSSRLMAELLEVHRKTVIASYEELIIQGWIITMAKRGTYVHGSIPLLKKRQIRSAQNSHYRSKAAFTFEKKTVPLLNFDRASKDMMSIKDGVADERLAPIDEISTLYKKILSRQNSRKYVGYHSLYGNPELREVLVQYLKDTRCINVSKENILITRGSQMGMFLSAQLLFKNGGDVVVGTTNYNSASKTFRYSGAGVKTISVDGSGIVTEELEELCARQPVKAVYVTPHHHHPTTVTLSAERRMHLLNLAQTYNFAIIEDDYDYDFHYNHAPILPLVSHDENGHVIYVGSFCKTVAPVYRVGYLIASKDFVGQCAQLRGIVDRQGDSILELTFAKFIQNGSLDRHIRRVLKIYRVRRDLFCKLLQDELGQYVNFKRPLGGMAVWIQFKKQISLTILSKIAIEYKLHISNWDRYYVHQVKHDALRIGFAAYEENEIIELIARLKKSIIKYLA